MLAFTIGLLLLVSFYLRYIGTAILLGTLMVLQIVGLIRYLEKSHQQLEKFLSSIHYDDFTETFTPKGEGAVFDALYRKFNEVIFKFREIRAEKEADAHYYRTVVHHVGTGIISYKKSGQIHLFNASAKRLLQIPHLNSVEELKNLDPENGKIILELKHGQKALIKLEQKGQMVQMAVNAIDISLRGEEYRLLSIQNIQQELEEKEMEAWQNLIKVLTHEIMNSVTPISSLAASVSEDISDYLQETDEKQLIRRTELEDVEKAMYTIKRRSEGLMRFVQDFRNLSQVPQPDIKPVNIKDLFQRVALLFKPEFEANKISLQLSPPPPGMVLMADENLLEQVLINLLKNAAQALAESPDRRIALAAYQTQNSHLVLEVSDNGPGIKKEALDRIFIPFYTTKKGGSGIGLSLAKQIMRLHNGTISVHSPAAGGCTFRLQF